MNIHDLPELTRTLAAWYGMVPWPLPFIMFIVCVFPPINCEATPEKKKKKKTLFKKKKIIRAGSTSFGHYERKYSLSVWIALFDRIIE